MKRVGIVGYGHLGLNSLFNFNLMQNAFIIRQDL